MAEMARALGHEINNTLAAMSLRLEMLGQDVPPDSPAHDNVTVLEAAARQGTMLVARVRALARLARPLVPRPVSVSAVVDDAVDAVQPRVAAAPGVELVVERGPALTVTGDRAELALAVRELLDNALDAIGDAGRVRVTTGLRGRTVACGVEDDGPGLGPEALARAFEPFFTTRPDRGRGLGLTIALAVAARHDGDLHLASPAAGVGCVATLELPAAR
jgi:signal transduction histidine kinase